METHGSFFKADEDDLLQIVDVNVTAVMLLARAFGHKMCERNRGGILFVSSILSPGMPWLSTYSASKSFVTCLALTLREELSRSNVHCMALEPGLVATEMTVKDEDVETANNSASNKWLMGTEECVSEALRVFGKEACFTPGLMNRIVKHCFLLLPRTVSLWLMSGYMLRVVDHKELNI